MIELPELGDRAREIVTGHEGTLTGVSEWLWGCRQYLLHYLDQDGKPQSDWYDVGRLVVLERGVIDAIDYSASEPATPSRLRQILSGAETPPAAR